MSAVSSRVSEVLGSTARKHVGVVAGVRRDGGTTIVGRGVSPPTDPVSVVLSSSCRPVDRIELRILEAVDG